MKMPPSVARSRVYQNILDNPPAPTPELMRIINLTPTRYSQRNDYPGYCRHCGKFWLSHAGMNMECPNASAGGLTKGFLRNPSWQRTKPHIFWCPRTKRWRAFAGMSTARENIQAYDFCAELNRD